MSEEVQRVEVITSVQRRRRWSVAEKIRLVEETLQPGLSSIEQQLGKGMSRCPATMARILSPHRIAGLHVRHLRAARCDATRSWVSSSRRCVNASQLSLVKKSILHAMAMSR
jgi:hypothetical protein